MDKFGVITSAVYVTLVTLDTRKIAGIALKAALLIPNAPSHTHIFGHFSEHHIFGVVVLPFLLSFLLILEFCTDASSFWAPVPEILVHPPLVLPHTHVHTALFLFNKVSGLTFQSGRSGPCRQGSVLVVRSRLARAQSQLDVASCSPDLFPFDLSLPP